MIFVLLLLLPFFSYAQLCEQVSQECIAPGETRTISGYEVYRDCWSYAVDYNCLSTTEYIDTCSSLRDINCDQVSSSCSEEGSDGICNIYTNNYRCDHQLEETSGIINIDTEYNITGEYDDNSQCLEFAEGLCNLKTEECIEGPETRNISGLEVHRNCWKYRRVYECLGSQFTNDCSALEQNCIYDGEECILRDANDNCSHIEKRYICEVEGGKTPTSLQCSSQTYCIDGDCESFSIPQNDNFARAVSALGMLDAISKDFDRDNLTIFGGGSASCDKEPLGFNNCCRDDGFGQDLGLASCKEEEKLLIEQQEAGLCHYVGTYCSTDILGACLTKSKGYCCFKSKISRIVHQQGRPQLGINFGEAESPECQGLTPEQLQDIDFGQVDFSEIYGDIYEDLEIPDSSAVNNHIQGQLQNFFDSEVPSLPTEEGL